MNIYVSVLFLAFGWRPTPLKIALKNSVIVVELLLQIFSLNTLHCIRQDTATRNTYISIWCNFLTSAIITISLNKSKRIIIANNIVKRWVTTSKLLIYLSPPFLWLNLRSLSRFSDFISWPYTGCPKKFYWSPVKINSVGVVYHRQGCKPLPMLFRPFGTYNTTQHKKQAPLTKYTYISFVY